MINSHHHRIQYYHMNVRIFAVALVGLLFLTGCGKKEESAEQPTTTTGQQVQPSVTAVTMTRGIDANNNATNATSTFASNDTIYALADVNNTNIGTPVEARWYHATSNQQINTNTVSTTSAGAHKVPFFIARPDAWPSGDYRVEILINGQVMNSQTFKVQ
jgi:hypothetical protein